MGDETVIDLSEGVAWGTLPVWYKVVHLPDIAALHIFPLEGDEICSQVWATWERSILGVRPMWEVSCLMESALQMQSLMRPCSPWE